MSIVGAGLVGIWGADVAFYAVFGVFVVAFVVLAVLTLRWAVRRDRAGRAAWAHRRETAEQVASAGTATPGGTGPATGGGARRSGSRE